MPQDRRLPYQQPTQNLSATAAQLSSNSFRVRRTQSLSSLNTCATRFAPSSYGDEVSIDTTASLFRYIERSRSALESQRIAFEREQATFTAERRLWETERDIMSNRISELEDQVSHATRATNTAAATTVTALAQPQSQTRVESTRVWEPVSPTADPVRAFPPEFRSSCSGSKNNGQFDPQSVPCLDDAVSPGSRVKKSTHMSVPVELLDSSLDGITLKSTGLPAEAIARMSPLSRSKYSSSLQQPVAKSNGREHSPSLASTRPHTDENFEHTTMASASRSTLSGRFQTLGINRDEQPLAPQQTREQLGTSDSPSSSSSSRLDDDPALQGPLNLQNDAAVDDTFLRELDQKLSNEARVPISDSLSGPGGSPSAEKGPEIEPTLRFRNATNFGTAFGSSQCRGR